MTGGTPRGTPEAVECRPETVVVLPGTRRMLARNFLVVHVGRRDEPTFDVVLVVGIDGHVSAWNCGRWATKESALQAALEFARGARVQLVGGGYRPLRVIDLVEFAAADSLDAYDREQAMMRARQG